MKLMRFVISQCVFISRDRVSSESLGIPSFDTSLACVARSVLYSMMQ